MSNNNITLIRLDTVHLYIDTNKKIMFFDVLTSNYSKNDSVTVLEYFKNFWLLAEEQRVKYYLVIKINSVGVYPLSFYNNLTQCLYNLNEIFTKYLHSCCFLCPKECSLTMLKPLLNSYTLLRPFSIKNTYEDVIIYFNKPENNL